MEISLKQAFGTRSSRNRQTRESKFFMAPRSLSANWIARLPKQRDHVVWMRWHSWLVLCFSKFRYTDSLGIKDISYEHLHALLVWKFEPLRMLCSKCSEGSKRFRSPLNHWNPMKNASVILVKVLNFGLPDHGLTWPGMTFGHRLLHSV